MADVPLVENFNHILHFLKIAKHNNISELFMWVLLADSSKLHSNSGIFSAALGPFSKHRCYIEVHKLLQTLLNLQTRLVIAAACELLCAFSPPSHALTAITFKRYFIIYNFFILI